MMDTNTHDAGHPVTVKYNEVLDAGKIRLLELMPGKPDEPASQMEINFKLAIMGPSLKDYIALSYCSDEPVTSDCPTINISGNPAHTTSNLYDFLMVCRNKGYTKRLWIAGVSIDQQNPSERKGRVMFTTSVYQNAKTVVWLGRGDRLTNRAMDYMASYSPEDSCLRGAQPTEDLNNGASYIFAKLWTQSVWTLQEVWAAKQIEVWCGSKELKWDRYQAWMNVFLGRRPDLQVLLRPGLEDPEREALLSLEKYLNFDDGQRTLLSLILNSTLWKCREPRDRILAFVGMAVDDEQLEVDYEGEDSVFYAKFTVYMMGRYGKHMILSLPAQFGDCNTDPKPVPDLPTWALNWSTVKSLTGSGQPAGNSGHNKLRFTHMVKKYYDERDSKNYDPLIIVFYVNFYAVVTLDPKPEKIYARFSHNRYKVIPYSQEEESKDSGEIQYRFALTEVPIEPHTDFGQDVTKFFGVPLNAKAGDIIVSERDTPIPLVLRPVGETRESMFQFVGYGLPLEKVLKIEDTIGYLGKSSVWKNSGILGGWNNECIIH